MFHPGIFLIWNDDILVVTMCCTCACFQLFKGILSQFSVHLDNVISDCDILVWLARKMLNVELIGWCNC